LPEAIFLGFLTGEELSRTYASADIFVFPSTTESFGNVVLEASASGLPCVIAAEGGVMDLIQDGESGFIARPNDAFDFARKMEILIANQMLRDSFSATGLKLASSKKWNEVNKNLFRSYEELLSKNKCNIDDWQPAVLAATYKQGHFENS
jgi:glycosyltransferase involved in cell wall biosynthesis